MNLSDNLAWAAPNCFLAFLLGQKSKWYAQDEPYKEVEQIA